MNTPHPALFQEDPQQAEAENEFSEQEQRQMMEIWAKLKAKKQSKNPRVSTSNTSATGSIQYSEQADMQGPSFREMGKYALEHSPIPNVTISPHSEPTSNQLLLFEKGQSVIQEKEEQEDQQYAMRDETTRLAPHAFMHANTTVDPQATLNYQNTSQTGSSAERRISIKERLEFLNQDNVKLFLENRHLNQQNLKLKQENQLLAEENSSMKKELLKLRADFASLSKNSVSIEAFKAEMGRLTALAGERQRVQVPQCRYPLQRQQSPLRHQSPPRMHVTSPLSSPRMVRSPPKQSMIVTHNGFNHPPHFPPPQYVASQQIVHEKSMRATSPTVEEQRRWQQKQKELVNRIQTFESEKKFQPTQFGEARTPFQKAPIFPAPHIIQQQYSRVTAQQRAPQSAQQAQIRNLRDANARLVEQVSRRAPPPQPVGFVQPVIDSQKERQLRNAKLVYEAENSKLKQEMAAKEARISQLLQEVGKSERSSDSGSYDTGRYSTPGVRPY